MIGAFGVWLLIRVFSEQVLDRVAIYRETTGFRICAATELHDCRIRGGTVMGRDRVAVVPRIAPQVSCDGHAARARDECNRSHPVTDYGNREQLRTFAECMARNGVVEGDATSLSDPREDHLSAKGFEMQCREGFRSGEFEQEGY